MDEFVHSSRSFKQLFNSTMEVPGINVALTLKHISNMSEEKENDHSSNCVKLGYDPLLTLAAMSYHVTVYVYTILVVLGISSNMLGIRVFLSKEMRNNSTHVYLLVLAISDSCYLLTLFFSRALESIKCVYFPRSNIDVYHHSDIACKGLQYLLDLWSDYSTCLILAFTVERFIACYKAVAFSQVCNPLKARTTCICIFFSIAIVTLPYHIVCIGFMEDYDVCTIKKEYEQQFTIIYVLEAALLRIIPVFLIAVLNGFIIFRIWGMSKRSRIRRSMRMSATSQISHSQSTSETTHDQDKHTQITLTLIFISTCYIITYIPVLVYFLLDMSRSNGFGPSEETMIVYRNFSRCLYVLGHSINFFLYTISGKLFRKQLKDILCYCGSQ